MYLPHTRFNMIPKELSEELCSLHEGYDKLAISIIYHVTKEYEIIRSSSSSSEEEEEEEEERPWFGRTVIRSVHSMSYEQAQAILEGSEKAPKNWRQRRNKRGFTSDDENESKTSSSKNSKRSIGITK